jgi:hypothetical protein
MYISNDKEIYLSVIVNQLSKYKQYNGDFIIKYITESKCIIYSIDTFPKYSYTCELNILKIINIDRNNILILTTDNKLYSLKIKNNIFKLIYKKKNIKNIFYDKDTHKILGCFFKIYTNGIIEIKCNKKIYFININYDNIDINNIKFINKVMNTFYIETYDNIVFIYKLKNELNLELEFYLYKTYINIKKIIYSFTCLFILNNDGILYYIPTINNSNISIKSEILENKFLDLKIRNGNTLFGIGLLENKQICMIDNNIMSEYVITDELKTYLINIKKVNICYKFIYALTENNTAIIWGPLIQYYKKPYIMIENIINIYSTDYKLVLITNINIIIINSNYQYFNGICTLTNPLLYENVLSCYSSTRCDLFIIKSNNEILELDYVIRDINNLSNNKYFNIHEENDLKYTVKKIVNTNIKKIIFTNSGYYIYIDENNNIFTSFINVYDYTDNKCGIYTDNNNICDIYIL